MDRKTTTYRIRLWGVVQGVGFRPFVAKLAAQFGIKGEVRNTGGLVEIVLTDSSLRVEKWIKTLKEKKPEPAEIIHIKTEEIPYRAFEDFKILDSETDTEQIVMFPPDLAICRDCADEAENQKDPRREHPFISCMVCGPRYTIIDRLPYDRENTAMDKFPMCRFCAGEYTDSKKRRYHAQTISCHDCGPVLLVKEKAVPTATGVNRYEEQVKGNKKEQREQNKKARKEENDKEDSAVCGRSKNSLNTQNAVARIKQGQIIALKGIGGYYFVCSAENTCAVKNLRQLKRREEKPFAVMFAGLEQIRQVCLTDAEEENLLTSSARPIVLLQRKEHCRISPEVYKTSRCIGAFLPAMALQTMMIKETGPLVMTSANPSDSPIIKDDEEMFAALQDPLLHAVFYHEREIRVRLDDSVVRVVDGQPQITRRSKGYVPSPIHIGGGDKGQMVLGTGGQLKAAFCLTKGSFAYMSQHFGDLEDSDSCRIYEDNIHRMQRLFGIKPQAVACDLHPGYFTTSYAASTGLPVIYVQHHHAHIASVMAESGVSGQIIGIAFDGTGYGTDGNIWGGEFLICENGEFERAAYLEYVNILGGDSSMKQGWKTAMCHIIAAEEKSEQKIRHPYKEDGRYAIIRKAIGTGVNKISTSSMGRLFDAVAALCGIQEENRYEGECAVMLENEAAAAIEKKTAPMHIKFDINRMVQKEERCCANQKDGGASADIIDGTCINDKKINSAPWVISSEPVIRAVAGAGATGDRQESAALGFHHAVAEMICEVCEKIRGERSIGQVALSGGVFQNKILMEESIRLLQEKGFEVHYNRSVPPGDGGIALGQAYIAKKRLERKEAKTASPV